MNSAELMQYRISELEAEVEKFRTLFESVCRLSWDVGEIDGGDWQDTAADLGLLVEVPGDEAFCADYGDGEMMWTWAWSELATPEADGRGEG